MSETAQTLRDLIQSAKEKHGTDSASALARKGKEAGFAVSHSTLSSITANTYPSRPSKATLDAIAYLAGVPYAVVHQAAGLGEPGPPFAEQLPRDVDKLTPSQRNIVQMVIRGLLEASSNGDSAPAPPPGS